MSERCIDYDLIIICLNVILVALVAFQAGSNYGQDIAYKKSSRIVKELLKGKVWIDE